MNSMVRNRKSESWSELKENIYNRFEYNSSDIRKEKQPREKDMKVKLSAQFYGELETSTLFSIINRPTNHYHPHANSRARWDNGSLVFCLLMSPSSSVCLETPKEVCSHNSVSVP